MGCRASPFRQKPHRQTFARSTICKTAGIGVVEVEFEAATILAREDPELIHKCFSVLKRPALRITALVNVIQFKHATESPNRRVLRSRCSSGVGFIHKLWRGSGPVSQLRELSDVLLQRRGDALCDGLDEYETNSTHAYPDVPGPPGFRLNPPGMCASKCLVSGKGTAIGLPMM